MDSKQIVYNVGTAVAHFINEQVPGAADKFENRLKTDWENIWPDIRQWLILSQDHLLEGPKETIISFVDTNLNDLPEYKYLRNKINVSIEVNKEFWNYIHTNLCIARSKLN